MTVAYPENGGQAFSQSIFTFFIKKHRIHHSMASILIKIILFRIYLPCQM